MAADLQVIALTVILYTTNRVVGQAATTRPTHIAGYPVDSGYRPQDRGPQQFTPVNEESSQEQKYVTAQGQVRQQQQQQQQQPSLFTPEQQKAVLQQHYQAYAQLLNQQQQYLSSTQQQQVQQQRVQLPQQFQQQQLYSLQQPQQPQQLYSHQQPQQPQQQQLQQRQPDDALTSTVALLGVKYSAAPSVARTIYRTNTGVSFSY